MITGLALSPASFKKQFNFDYMTKTFAVTSKSFSLYKAIKEEAEKLGWHYYEDFMDFDEENMKRCDCLYFSIEWPDYNGDNLFAFTNHLDEDKRFYLPGDWSEVIEHLKKLTPSQKGDVLNTMITDPNNAQAAPANQEAIAEQAAEGQVNAAESAAQDAAVDAEEGE